MSCCTLMGQCFCFDLRCAFPCDPSNVPITIGLCGLLCVNCKRGGCGDQCGNINLYKLCPCFSKGVWGDRKKSFGLEEAPLTFRMRDRQEVTVKDRGGNVCVVRKLEGSEIESYKLKIENENLKAPEVAGVQHHYHYHHSPEVPIQAQPVEAEVVIENMNREVPLVHKEQPQV
mmetsp:Transcript_11026/g.10653  ORF Transcript_11026/g.10653 Transcript_11026/m.10653 type:complete len:173 (-) Transcript_11026:124-642(-)